ncbi:variable surface lipoprotein [Metamycoplasma auris]|uniref:Variable surface lipoprotein n=1 Tax=Metamycoplasma auris TaxID=51363 RepID=A0A2W7G578_9BACT|nr:variable surface lipoprotein [Metamycoplasma auris]PZV98747.1 hypothetical protein BCF89_11116 [Metamycoplasma auris]
MKKINRFLITIGSITPLVAMPLIAAKCSNKTNKNKENINKKDLQTSLNVEKSSTTTNETKKQDKELISKQSSSPKKEPSELEKLKAQINDLIKEFEEISSKI